MPLKAFVLVFLIITKISLASPDVYIDMEQLEKDEKNFKEKYDDRGMQSLESCYVCSKPISGKTCTSSTRFCYLCKRFYCEQHCTNNFAKVSMSGGIICDHCFLDIGTVFDERIDKICRLKELLKIYEKLFLFINPLSKQLNYDAELVNSQKFKENIKDATGNSFGVISSSLLISSRIALLAVPGCQVISIISLCSLVSGISSIAIKEGGSLALDQLEIKSLANMNLIATLFSINQLFNMQLDSEFNSQKDKAQCEILNEIYSNPLVSNDSEDEEHFTIKAAKKIVPIALKSVVGVLGLANSSLDLFSNSMEIISGEESDLGQLFVKIAEELEKFQDPSHFREKIKMLSMQSTEVP